MVVVSLPASFARVLGMLRRISPPWPSTDSQTSVGAELGSIAVAIGTATDPLDSVLDEVFPDTTTQLLDRWEKVTRIPSRTGDSLAVRRARVLAVLRRTSGPRLDQLAKMLSGPLGIDANDMQFFEPLRSMIEEALTVTTGVVSLAVPSSGFGVSVQLGKPWPGVVDDTGVMVYIALSSVGVTTALLLSPNGMTWSVPVNATSGWYFTRTAFTGVAAAGTWTLLIADTSAPTLTEFRLLVSNNVDAGQIYNFFVLRDPTLPGTADMTEAQRLFHRTALGNMRAFIIETMAFMVGDTHSLVTRDPVGV